jgi:hypothetical protein
MPNYTAPTQRSTSARSAALSGRGFHAQHLPNGSPIVWLVLLMAAVLCYTVLTKACLLNSRSPRYNMNSFAFVTGRLKGSND